MLPILLLLVAAITLRVGSTLQKFYWLVEAVCYRFYCCWCCYYTTVKAYAAQIFAVGVAVMLPILMLVLLLHYG